MPYTPTNPNRWNTKTRLAAVMQSAAIEETESPANRCDHGLYLDLQCAWKQAFEAMDSLKQPAKKADVAASQKQARQKDGHFLIHPDSMQYRSCAVLIGNTEKSGA